MPSASKGNPNKLFWGYKANVSDNAETEHIVLQAASVYG